MSLTDFIFAHNEWFEADCIQITLPNGSILRATSHQNNLVVGGNTYYAMKYGKWSRGSTSQDATRGQTTETEITMTCDHDILFPNSVSTPMFQRSKLFSRSQVKITVCYMDLDEIIQGTKVVFLGVISIPTLESSKVTFKCTDMSYILQAPWSKRVIQAGAAFSVFEPQGGLDKEDFAVTRTVLSGSTQTFLHVAALGSVGNDSLPYTKGWIVPQDGEAQGWAIGVTIQPDTTHLSLAPFDLPIAIGDTFKIYPGDDGKATTWDQKFSNLSKFPGFPWVPQPDTAVQGS